MKLGLKNLVKKNHYLFLFGLQEKNKNTHFNKYILNTYYLAVYYGVRIYNNSM